MSNADPHAIVRYLRECYRENGSRGGLWNFFGNSVHNRVFVDGESDPILKDPTGVDSHFLRGKTAGNVAKQAHLYQKERDLWYATVFVVGWVERYENQPVPVCAPLFLYPATLEVGDMANGAVLQIDSSRGQLNAAVLEAIGGEGFFRAIERETEKGPLSEGCVGTVRQQFAEAFPDAGTDALLNYPDLVKGRELKKIFDGISKNSDSPLTLVSAAAVALVNKSGEMRGVLNELEEMGNLATVFSPPIQALLGGADTIVEDPKMGRIPAHLSEAQRKVVDSSRRHPLTLAIGPPGTGKSFTIAALAIEAVSRGKSVIVASKMDHAVDVAGDKIESAIGLEGTVVRGGRKAYLKKLKTFIEELLSGIHTVRTVTRKELKALSKSLTRNERDIKALEKILTKRFKNEIKAGEVLVKKPRGWFQRWRHHRIEKRGEKRQPVHEIAEELYQETELLLKETLNYLAVSRSYYLGAQLKTGRQSFQSFSRAIRARTGAKAEEYFKNIEWRRILTALPVWLVNMSDVHKVLPFTSKKFDLAIIDEASQCDIASVLPILQRAKRAVIAGDPKQLRHLSFLPKKRQRELGDEHGLDAETLTQFDFRDVSLLDLAAAQIFDQNRIAFLNEHFRSRPEIIEFSNREFYAGKLRVMTGNHECTHRDQHAASPLKITHLADGVRGANGCNKIEAEHILALIVEICEAQAKDHPTAPPFSIGILSPFRNQVDFLRKQLVKLPLANFLLNRHDLLIGTAHTFQGEERDFMFISLALDDDSPSASFRFLEKPDLFNVAITRARQLNHVFHSFSPSRVSVDSFLGKYLAFVSAVETGVSTSSQTAGTEAAKNAHDVFAGEVANFLQTLGAEVTLGYQLAGTTIDLVYSLDGVSCGIDLVGYPGAFADAFPLERVLTFQRANLKIYPLAYSAWHFQRDECEAWIRSFSIVTIK